MEKTVKTMERDFSDTQSQEEVFIHIPFNSSLRNIADELYSLQCLNSTTFDIQELTTIKARMFTLSSQLEMFAHYLGA